MHDEDIASMTYEVAMTKLEQCVTQLEAGNVPLEDAIALYKKASMLSAHCAQLLHDAEQKIEMVIEQNGQKTKVPFVPQE
ncbi:MAG: exodeoxyribonuclease VII small subunit [Paenibacillaceae bacterium]|jgi:exodeoxyribonuclease VII small subunit|nr:exodeoxyribonuclease VII small subunit [Paenibacillaceae bacterium]